jgi:hypothetical protein
MKVDEIEGIEKLATKTDLRLAVAELKVDLLKWMCGIQLAFTALTLAIVYVILNHWKP